MHTLVANSLIARLQTYLLTKHNIDIGHDTETLKVQPQDNNCDCGFHVLLYIQGFDKMEIFNISTLICPILHQQEWFVFFVSPDISEKVIILHSTDSKKQNDHIHFSEVFGGKVHKAFMQCGIASPIPVSDTSKAQVSNTTFNAKSKYSALAGMLFLEEYNGYVVRIKLKNEITVNDYRDLIMVHVLLHEENTAKLPPQIMEIVERRDKRSRKKA
ncbi:hypothetical protein GUJ93_ZPchr0012g20801 [Zizania palustris]|uniref:Ubiquitin-like protease family profile domain-containing protein n=1 Tax=Zizania palustris TaxID=103762 RepID=A0A8J5WNX2_ZIZPA|nr:hypothetical protein GUJ93_ZPchr0012g20801 [Zizania palustris]